MNISVPDEVIDRAKGAGLDVSRMATVALVEALNRQSKIDALDALDAYLDELERGLGPVSTEEAAAATAWVDGLLAGSTPQTEHRQLRPPAVAPFEGSV